LKSETLRGTFKKEMNFSFSLSGITRTGSMGLISARFFQAPLIISGTKLSEKKLKSTFPIGKKCGFVQKHFHHSIYCVDILSNMPNI